MLIFWDGYSSFTSTLFHLCGKHLYFFYLNIIKLRNYRLPKFVLIYHFHLVGCQLLQVTGRIFKSELDIPDLEAFPDLESDARSPIFAHRQELYLRRILGYSGENEKYVGKIQFVGRYLGHKDCSLVSEKKRNMPNFVELSYNQNRNHLENTVTT